MGAKGHLRHANTQIDNHMGSVKGQHAAVGNDLAGAQGQGVHGCTRERRPPFPRQGAVVVQGTHALPVQLSGGRHHLSTCRSHMRCPKAGAQLLTGESGVVVLVGLARDMAPVGGILAERSWRGMEYQEQTQEAPCPHRKEGVSGWYGPQLLHGL